MDVIDLTDEPDSPVRQHRALPPNGSREPRRNSGGVSLLAGDSQQTGGPRRSARVPTVIDLTDDADDDGLAVLEGSGVPPRPQSVFGRALAGFQGGGGGGGDDAGDSEGASSRNMSQSAAQAFFNIVGVRGGFSVGGLGGLAQMTNFALGSLPNLSNIGGRRRPTAVPPNRFQRRRLRAVMRRHAQIQAQAHLQPDYPSRDAAPASDGFWLPERLRFAMNPLGNRRPDLDYQLNGLFQGADVAGGADAAVGPEKPPYVEPPAPPEGYTRNLGDELVAVCAGCDEELAYDPDNSGGAGSSSRNGEPPAKRRNRKEREEHHFWAATACGHVYCRRCFDNRKNAVKGGKSPRVYFATDGKAVFCAADGCRTDVTAKKAWVGLFV